MLEKPGLEDSDTTETDDVEKAKKAEDTTPEKATTKVAANATPKKVTTETAEMAAQEDSTEMAADSTPKEDSQEKAKLPAHEVADKDFELVVAEALERVGLNLSA